jgi:DNA-binding response OmpR family regulator
MEEAKGTILIVDDEEAIRGILARKLTSDGYNCEVAVDGKEALWKAFMKDFDLVLMDIKMPGISGMEALPQIITNHPDTCVIMMTAVVDTETAVQAMKLGAYDYVTKPFDLDDLGMRIEKALERRKLILENRDQQLRLEQKVHQQALQIQEYYRKAVENLSREQMALENSRTESKSGAEAANKHAESSGSVREFAKKLSQLFSKATPDLSDVNVDATSARKQTSGEVPLVGIPAEKEENPTLYNGSVELSFSRPVNLQQILQFYNTLKYVRQVDVVDVVGLVEKDVTIKLLLETPTPLTKILKVLPEVEDVSDGSQDAGEANSDSQKEVSPVNKIVIGLAAKNHAASNHRFQNKDESDSKK